MYSWGDDRRFHSYAAHFRALFGERVQKLSVNAGFTCPNRDGTLGTDGCTFCSNEAFTPSYCLPEKSVRQQLEEGIQFHRNRYREARQYLAYFQSFSNTYGSLERLRTVYAQAFELPEVAGIVVGTRPDCVDDEKLDYFAELAREHYVAIEYGVESCSDDTLQAVGRGHDFACARRAIEATAARGIAVGAHFILGLPGESRESMIAQADQINALPLSTIKFHQLQIFRDTPMAVEYASSPEQFAFFELDEYIDLFIDLLERLRPSLVIERFASEAPPRFQVGPTWDSIRNEQLLSLLERRLAVRDTHQGAKYAG